MSTPDLASEAQAETARERSEHERKTTGVTTRTTPCARVP